jgi:carboxymethylenebutenolidase
VPDLTIPGGHGIALRAYLARPAVGNGPWPGVVVIHDAFGLTAVAREHADRLSAAGYLALVPDLYTRGGFLRCVRATFAALMSGAGVVYEDLDAARRWLAAQDACTGRIGVIGFCMGGGFALMTAHRDFAVAAPNYGRLPADLSVLDRACPIVASYGAKDRSLKGEAARLAAALMERGIRHDVKEYPDAGHSFLDRFNVGPFTPLLHVAGLGYHHPSAEDAWRRILRFFADELRTAPDHRVGMP